MTSDATRLPTARRAVAIGGAALIWGVHLGVTYLLVPVACRWATTWPLHGVTAVALALALTATVTADRERRASAEGEAWFPPVAAVALSALFTFAIVLSEIAVLLVDPCLS